MSNENTVPSSASATVPPAKDANVEGPDRVGTPGNASAPPLAERGSAPEPVYDLVEVAPPVPSATEPVVETPAPAVAETDAAETTVIEHESQSVPLAATSAAPMQTIYVPSPVPPRRKGNRGFGVLIALLSSLVFAALYALAIAAIHAVEIGELRFDFFGSLAFYTPIAFFFLGFVIVALLVNRASWWGFVFGSIVVALIVYFGSVGTSLLVNNVFVLTPTNTAQLFSTALASPFIIAAALLAREVSMWMGALISARGRKVKMRNIEATENFDRESAARTAEYENSRYRTPEATV